MRETDRISVVEAAHAGPTESRDEFSTDVREGLARAQKALPSKYLYDALGSALFEAITELPEYGLTRAEERILGRHAGHLAALLPRGIAVAELGAGSGRKTLPVLDAILAGQRTVSYAAIDLSAAALDRCRNHLGSRPGVRFTSFEAPFVEGLARVEEARDGEAPLLVLFLGSTIGNFDVTEQLEFLDRVRSVLREGDALLLGADLQTSEERLLPAYDDPTGVTAAFDLNVLARINRELGADFELAAFRHQARWSEEAKRVEMHLRSLRHQEVTIPGARCRITLRERETIWTESSHKFTLDALGTRAAASGFVHVADWIDETWPFADVLWAVGPGGGQDGADGVPAHRSDRGGAKARAS